MNFIFSINTKRNITVGILTLLCLVFIHSELDLLNCNEDDHHAHDFCRLVDTVEMPVIKTVAANKISDIPDNLSSVCCEKDLQVSLAGILYYDRDSKPKLFSSADTYLQNRILLI